MEYYSQLKKGILSFGRGTETESIASKGVIWHASPGIKKNLVSELSSCFCNEYLSVEIEVTPKRSL